MSHPDIPVASIVVIGGGIGAGKSSVLEVFEQDGFLVIEADRVGHEILASNHDAGRRVMHRWPCVVVDGEVARSKLAQIVFSDRDALRELEAITHPAIEREITRRVKEATGAVAIEIPILGMFSHAQWHRIAVVAPEEVRVARVVVRGGEPNDVRARITNQPSTAEWTVWADTVIDNGGSWEQTAHALEAFIGRGASE